MLRRRPTSKPVGNAAVGAAAVTSAQAMPDGAAVVADQVALDAQPDTESAFNDWYKEKHFLSPLDVQLRVQHQVFIPNT